MQTCLKRALQIAVATGGMFFLGVGIADADTPANGRGGEHLDDQRRVQPDYDGIFAEPVERRRWYDRDVCEQRHHHA